MYQRELHYYWVQQECACILPAGISGLTNSMAARAATQKQVGYRVPRPADADGEQKQREEQEKVDNGVLQRTHE